jgi:phenylacetic acid degradation operon negative regulatory protein
MTPFKHSRAALLNGKTFGAWSLIVTFFGDMAQETGDKISGSALTTLSEHLEIKPQAMRVALHRLRKDRWIDSVKSGRRSSYFLTDASRAESANASSRIYSQTAPSYQGFSVIVTEPKVPIGKPIPQLIWLDDHIWICFAPEFKSPRDAIQTHYDGAVPSWVSRRIFSSKTLAGYRELHQSLEKIHSERWAELSTFEIAALRILIVHNWRRLTLRHANFPDEAFPAECPIRACREKVFQLLAELPKPDLASLNHPGNYGSSINPATV